MAAVVAARAPREHARHRLFTDPTCRHELAALVATRTVRGGLTAGRAARVYAVTKEGHPEAAHTRHST